MKLCESLYKEWKTYIVTLDAVIRITLYKDKANNRSIEKTSISDALITTNG